MVRLDTVFRAGESITPEFAAKLAECAERYRAEISLECGGRKMQIDSLICILALDLYRGVPVRVVAEGEDEGRRRGGDPRDAGGLAKRRPRFPAPNPERD